MSPLYDRYCTRCETLQEDLLEPVADMGPLECPSCHKEALERIQSYPSSFQIFGYSMKNGYSK